MAFYKKADMEIARLDRFAGKELEMIMEIRGNGDYQRLKFTP